ncbi:MAG: Kelch repeat-containing protein [Planctomycetota bacterium]
MKRLNACRIKLTLFGIVAVIGLGGKSVEADFTWARKTDMPIKKYQPSTSVVGGKIYSIGGWYIDEGWRLYQWEALTRVDEYDPTTDTWTRKADMPTGRGHTNACVVDGKIYVIGGNDVSKLIMPPVEVYDPATDTWTRKADMPTRRGEFSTCEVDGIIYVMGGADGITDEFGIVEAYDPATDSWTTKADMPTGRAFFSTCAVDGLVYAIGGYAEPGSRSAVEVYDPATNTWTTRAPMPTPRYLLDVVAVDGKIYAIGGWWFSDSGPIYSTVEVYDPVTDTWTKGVDIPVTTAGFSTCVVNGRIYVTGGATEPHANNHWILTSAVYANEPVIDLNGDGIVDAADMCTIVDHWGEGYPLCDVGPMPFGDGIVNVEDLVVLSERLFEEVDDPTLIAHWPLDEAQGVIAYNDASDRDGTLNNGPVWQRQYRSCLESSGRAVQRSGLDQRRCAGPGDHCATGRGQLADGRCGRQADDGA